MEFRIVWDQPEDCPYLPGQTARLPLRIPDRRLMGADLDRQLEAGDRRTGRMLYKPRCPTCTACEPLRVAVADFTPTASQRRVWARNVGDVTVSIAPAGVDAQRLELYNRHKMERGLSKSGEPLTEESYRQWLVESCCDTVEVDYRVGGELVAVSLLDIGLTSASSVYHYFDPDHSRRSLGTFSAMAEMAWLREQGKHWYYFGLYVAACTHLAYKATYRPHERLVSGVWVPGT